MTDTTKINHIVCIAGPDAIDEIYGPFSKNSAISFANELKEKKTERAKRIMLVSHPPTEEQIKSWKDEAVKEYSEKIKSGKVLFKALGFCDDDTIRHWRKRMDEEGTDFRNPYNIDEKDWLVPQHEDYYIDWYIDFKTVDWYIDFKTESHCWSRPSSCVFIMAPDENNEYRMRVVRDVP